MCPRLVSLLNQERSNNKLYVSLVESAPTAYYDDKTLPSLPSSVLNVMQAGRTSAPSADDLARKRDRTDVAAVRLRGQRKLHPASHSEVNSANKPVRSCRRIVAATRSEPSALPVLIHSRLRRRASVLRRRHPLLDPERLQRFRKRQPQRTSRCAATAGSRSLPRPKRSSTPPPPISGHWRRIRTAISIPAAAPAQSSSA